MLKIRIKGKHLILGAGILLALVLIAYRTAPSLLYTQAQKLEAQGKISAANRLYEILEWGFPYTDQTARALYFTATRDLQSYQFGDRPGLVYIFPESSGMSNNPIEEINLPEVIADLKLVSQRFPNSMWARHASRELGRAYYLQADYPQAIKYLTQSVQTSGFQDSESTTMLAKIYLEQGEYQRGLELVSQSLKVKPGSDPLAMQELQGRALMGLGKWTQARQVFSQLPSAAKELYQRVLKDEDQKTVQFNIDHWQDLSQGYLRKLDGLEKGQGETGSIGGQVIKNGQGIPGVQVYLIDRAINEDYFTGNITNLSAVTTNSEGKFSFTNLITGDYALALGVSLKEINGFTVQQLENNIRLTAGARLNQNIQLIPTVKLKRPLNQVIQPDTINFRWQAVPKAASYDLFIGPVTRDKQGNITSSFTQIVRSKLKTNQVVLNLQGDSAQVGFGGGIAWNEQGVDPFSILGMYAGGEYTWGIYAYDRQGKRITDSTGYGFYQKTKDLPLFKVTNSNLNAADKFLLDRKYTRAIAEYEKILKNQPDNAHALLVLAKLYQYGIKVDDKNPKLAAEYYQRLLNLKDQPEVRLALADCYYDAKNYPAAEKLYNSLANTPQDNWQVHFKLAKMKFWAGQPQTALEMLQQVVNMPDGHYIGSYPVIIALLLDDSPKALDFAAKVEQGEEYLGLLQNYQQQGYKVNPKVKAQILAGEYNKALNNLTDQPPDLFIKRLLSYATSVQHLPKGSNPPDAQMKDSLLIQLWQKLIQ